MCVQLFCSETTSTYLERPVECARFLFVPPCSTAPPFKLGVILCPAVSLLVEFSWLIKVALPKRS